MPTEQEARESIDRPLGAAGWHIKYPLRQHPAGRTLWLRDQPITVLRALVRAHDLDSARCTGMWKDPGMLANFIADGMRARVARDAAFAGGRSGHPEE